MTMVNKEAEAGAAETKREEVTTSVEEANVIVMDEVAVQEAIAEEATSTTTMEEETVTASMEAEESTPGTMDTTTTCIRGINNTHSHISNNKCLQQSHSLIPRQVLDHSSITTPSTATPVRWVAATTVVNGATKGNNCLEQPNLVQRASS